MMCAATAGARGRRVLLADHADEPGKKILISGGGRCNFTNLHTAADRYLSSNPHFAKSALGRYTPQDFLTLVERHGIAWHEKTLGQLFCDGSARQVVDMLVDECAKAGVTTMLGHAATAIEHRDGCFAVAIGGREYTAPALVLATGGPSIPKLGATGFAYDVARSFGLSIVHPRPALVPFTLGADEALFRSLSGVSAEVEVHWQKVRFREAAVVVAPEGEGALPAPSAPSAMPVPASPSSPSWAPAPPTAAAPPAPEPVSPDACRGRRVYIQIHGPAQQAQAASMRQPWRRLGAVVPPVEDVLASARAAGRAPPAGYARPTILWHDAGSQACARLMAQRLPSPVGGAWQLRALPARLVPTPGTLEVWLPRPDLASAAAGERAGQ